VKRLTDRERQVLRLYLGGRGRKEIAVDLQISTATVNNQLASIYRKFGVSSMQELFALALRDAEIRALALQK